MVVILFLFAITLIIEGFSYFMNNAQIVERNGYGEGQKRETFQMRIEGEKKEEIELEVYPRIYTEQEIESIARQAIRELDRLMLNENASPDHVTKDLYLPQKIDGYPFLIQWEFSRYDVIDAKGKLNIEEIKEKDPKKQGILVELTAVLKYEGMEQLYERTVQVFYGVEERLTLQEQVFHYLEKTEKSTREKKSFPLPQEIKGKKITWKRKSESKLPALLGLACLVCVGLLAIEKEKQLLEKKNREEQMLLDYPEIISQFTLLMGAGMTAKNVWRKIVEDYKDTNQKSGITRYAYEEMKRTFYEMESGISEIEAYEKFARRNRLIPYMKLGTILAQNVQKGVKGTTDVLKMESIQALEERKNKVKRAGEEAGTKLLIPMVMMLMVVMLMIMVPAFLSLNV